MSLSACLDWINTLPNRPRQTRLSTIKRIACKLGIAPKSRIITITGTNGKGSCVAFLEAIYNAAGFRVGSFTSPHILKFNERIRVAKQDISDHELEVLLQKIQPYIDDECVGFFDVAMLVALLYFEQQGVDIILLEVGIGGRLDATNILDADVAVISSISLDHTQLLGESRAAVGLEKAGIFRADRPAVIGDAMVPQSVLEYAEQLHTRLWVIDRDFHYQQQTENLWQWHCKQLVYDELSINHLELSNAAVALMVIELMQTTLAVSLTAIKAGLQQTHLAGRFECIHNKPTVYVDVAHNPAACHLLAKRLANISSKGRCLAIVGMMQDKDHPSSLAELVDVIAGWYVVNLALPRAASNEALAQVLTNLCDKPVYLYESAALALQYLLRHAEANDIVIAFGSFLTVADAINYFKQEK